MKKSLGGILCASSIVIGLALTPASAGQTLFISVGDDTRAPIGWVEFCAQRPVECNVTPTAPRDAKLTAKS